MLTAHRSKGLEWDLVIVAGVQEGTWPDLRQRGSLLGMDELVEIAAGRLDEGPAAAEAAAAALVSKLLDEERRLFYVAVTRARQSLVVTAVGGGGEPRNGPPGSWPSWPATRSRSSTWPRPAGSGCRCRCSRPACAGPRPTPRCPDRSAGRPRPSWPGWRRRACPVPPPGTGTP